MNTDDKIQYWLENAQYDLETAIVMHKSGRYAYTSFMCQQTLEKALKALYIKRNEKEAPRTHNLTYLASLLELELDSKKEDIFAELTSYYLEGRYPDYKQKIYDLLSRERSISQVNDSKEVLEWILKLIKK